MQNETEFRFKFATVEVKKCPRYIHNTDGDTEQVRVRNVGCRCRQTAYTVYILVGQKSLSLFFFFFFFFKYFTPFRLLYKCFFVVVVAVEIRKLVFLCFEGLRL